jgi:hypothetical protein
MKTDKILGLLLAGAASAAGAQVAGGRLAAPTFDGLDTDKNGSLSQAEVGVWVATLPAVGPNGQPDPATVFGTWDANKDGSVSRQEFDSRPRFGGIAPGGGGAGGGQPPPG